MTNNQATEAAPTGAGDGSAVALLPFMGFWTVSFFAAALVSCALFGQWDSLFPGLCTILTSPCRLITDYFSLGGMPATLFNAGLCGAGCLLFILLTRPKPTSTLLAGFFLVIAHCFYGLNFLNMWPPFLGVALYALVSKKQKGVGDVLHLCMFATSLGPFISEFLFRYTLGDAYVPGAPRVTLGGAALALVFSVAAGFAVPALLPGTTRMHRGYNLFKAGLALGLFGIFVYCLMYRITGLTAPEAPSFPVPGKAEELRALLFMDGFFLFVLLCPLVWGFVRNGKSFRGYGRILACDGWQDDFSLRFGAPLTFVNVGLLGGCVLLYLNLAILLTEGVGFTGPTAGVVIAAITFSAGGQTPKNTFPITVGYVVLYIVSAAAGALWGAPLWWSVSTQSFINGWAFATGLCPFSGRYGFRAGVAAGMLHAILCTATAAMHGGFVLYNGGLTAGLTALLLLPLLEYYGAKQMPDLE